MKIYRQDIYLVLDTFNLGFEKDNNLKETIIDKIYNIYIDSKTLYRMPEKLVSLFAEAAKFELSKTVAKKIVYDLSCQTQLSDLFEELQNCDIIKDKLYFDRKEYLIILKVHDNFLVKTDLANQKTYINDKLYYDIEEQDLLECYCGFVNEQSVYILYNKRRVLSFIGLSLPYLKMLTDKNKIAKFKNNKNVYMIFTNTELIYKSL